MKEGPVGVLFDIDGTLVDSNYQHAKAWWRALDEAGYRTPIHRIHRCIGMGGDQLLTHLIGFDSDDLHEARARHFVPFHKELYAFDRAAELLRRVSQTAKVVIATSANKSDLEVLLAAIDATEAIDLVTSASEVPESKPEPDVFEKAMAKAELGAGEAIVLGDTPWDIEAARKAGLECVCVESGGWGRCELVDAGAAAVYRDVSALLEDLENSPIGKLLAR